jgi:hypothetical protein
MTTSSNGPNSEPAQVFPLFVALYATGFMMEMVERWSFPYWNAAGVALSIVTIVLAKHRIVFLAFLILTTAYFLLLRFPEVANHINLLIFCNILLILGLCYSYVSRIGREDFPLYFETLLSPLRLMLIVTYTVAGFHKLNYDFLNPEVSCIGTFLLNFLSTLKNPVFDTSALPAIPVVLIIFAIGTLFVLLLLRGKIRRLPAWLFVVAMGTVPLVIMLSTWGYLTEDLRPLLERHMTPLIVGVSGLIVFWQLVEGPLLMIRRFQAVFLCFALLFHTYLGMIGFVDFQSIAVALLLAFVPKPVLVTWAQHRHIRLGSVRFERVHAYVALNLMAGLLTGIHVLVTPLFEPSNVKALQGLLFNGGVLLLIWPIIRGVLSGPRGRRRWGGVSVFHSRTPKFLYLVPVLLLFFGMTSHLGLRTAGNFSMFSNLRTEGSTSNHILLGSNPLKIWEYQEDTVHVIKLDSAAADTGSHYDPKLLAGEKLPAVEFRKLVSKWADKNMTIAIVFEYDGKVFASDNIAADPTWRPARWDWEMTLLDFRAVQPNGPNKCRW